jgi:hypothetical protein
MAPGGAAGRADCTPEYWQQQDASDPCALENGKVFAGVGHKRTMTDMLAGFPSIKQVPEHAKMHQSDALQSAGARDCIECRASAVVDDDEASTDKAALKKQKLVAADGDATVVRCDDMAADESMDHFMDPVLLLPGYICALQYLGLNVPRVCFDNVALSDGNISG